MADPFVAARARTIGRDSDSALQRMLRSVGIVGPSGSFVPDDRDVAKVSVSRTESATS